MSTYETRSQERTELDDRDRRALEQYLTVTPDIGRAQGVDGWAIVTSESGREYLVDVREGSCQQKNGDVCPDQKYNLEAGEECKHVRRARIAMGETPVDSHPLAELDVDPNLGEHASGACVLTSDGGLVVSDDAEILETDDVDPWEGPFAEYDKYGQPTGEKFRRCRDCGLEIHTDVDRDHVSHRDGCRHGEGDGQ